MKYKLTDKTQVVDGHTLYRIKALKNFSDVKKEDLGGWIEKVENLSQEDNCWVYGNARVYEGRVTENIRSNSNRSQESQVKTKKVKAPKVIKEPELIAPKTISAIRWLECAEN